MKIILSPAKKMITDTDSIAPAVLSSDSKYVFERKIA